MGRILWVLLTSWSGGECWIHNTVSEKRTCKSWKHICNETSRFPWMLAKCQGKALCKSYILRNHWCVSLKATIFKRKNSNHRFRFSNLIEVKKITTVKFNFKMVTVVTRKLLLNGTKLIAFNDHQTRWLLTCPSVAWSCLFCSASQLVLMLICSTMSDHFLCLHHSILMIHNLIHFIKENRLALRYPKFVKLCTFLLT